MATKPQTRETSRHKDAFEAWYDAARNFRITAENCSVCERSLYSWSEKFGWHERADRRDLEAARIVDAAQTQAVADRLKRQRQAGELLRERGVEYLLAHPIDSARDAIAAIKAGIEIEQRADLLPDWVLAVLSATPDELEARHREIMREMEARRDVA